MKALTELQIRPRMKELEGWEFKNDALHTSFEFKDFKDTFSVMTRIAFEAEKLQHHPNWCNVYNYLEISLSTHDANGVTEKDFELAKIIDELVS
ncbi:MAG: 4a-hydroxytetrahydrobiopterin dehydratase [Alteromonas sp.]|nr:4a-hydroxytetrahydrobiopterin dehydratase [Alteromonas sp.]MAY22243.1 4a-hydroxytetrahydrobiopterin dehydratase [Flavobacteriaceae bacterium]|tara:strand:+ start:66 stop:347 length:282 start_codon:yes stop_codon:yes gene_type:complete